MVPTPDPPSIPDSVRLFKFFNEFLIRWANQECRYVGMRIEDLSPLPVEQGLLFFEPFEGIFVMRSSRGFEKFLVELIAGKKVKRGNHDKAVFLEMTVLYWHLLVSQEWRLDTRKLRPAILKNSVPLDWPDRDPQTACTIFIKDEPLEIRIWSGVTEEEANHWRKNPHSK